MATRNINLDTIYKEALHKPSVDSIPLYTHIDGKQETFMSGNEGARSQKWTTLSETTYSSPNNVRKVFFTSKKIVVQYYKPYIKSGKSVETGCWRTTALKDTDGTSIDLIEMGMNMINYDNLLMQYKISGQNTEKPENIKIGGTGLVALHKPWVCSNIEEVYFDHSILFSSVYRNLGFENILQLILSNQSKILDGKIAQGILVNAVNTNIKNLRNRYPRLKCVGLISNLDTILNQNYDKGKPGIDSVQELREFWYLKPINKDLIKGAGGVVSFSKLTDGISPLNKTFALRSEIYKFDAELLYKFFEEYKERILNFERQQRDIKLGKATSPEVGETVIEESNNTNNVKSELEELFDEIYSKAGEKEAKKLANLTFSGYTKLEILTEINKMSTEGKNRYNPFK